MPFLSTYGLNAYRYTYTPYDDVSTQAYLEKQKTHEHRGAKFGQFPSPLSFPFGNHNNILAILHQCSARSWLLVFWVLFWILHDGLPWSIVLSGSTGYVSG